MRNLDMNKVVRNRTRFEIKQMAKAGDVGLEIGCIRRIRWDTERSFTLTVAVQYEGGGQSMAMNIGRGAGAIEFVRRLHAWLGSPSCLAGEWDIPCWVIRDAPGFGAFIIGFMRFDWDEFGLPVFYPRDIFEAYREVDDAVFDMLEARQREENEEDQAKEEEE